MIWHRPPASVCIRCTYVRDPELVPNAIRITSPSLARLDSIAETLKHTTDMRSGLRRQDFHIMSFPSAMTFLTITPVLVSNPHIHRVLPADR